MSININLSETAKEILTVTQKISMGTLMPDQQTATKIIKSSLKKLCESGVESLSQDDIELLIQNLNFMKGDIRLENQKMDDFIINLPDSKDCLFFK